MSRLRAYCCGLDGEAGQGFAVFIGGFLRDVGGHCGGWLLFVPAGGFEPVTDELLVEAWWVLAFCIAVCWPETAGVWGQGFVHQGRVPSSSRPNSNLVSAMMMPRVAAYSTAALYRAIEVSRTLAASSAPMIASHCSKLMFSSWSPTAALVEGVKIG